MHKLIPAMLLMGCAVAAPTIPIQRGASSEVLPSGALRIEGQLSMMSTDKDVRLTRWAKWPGTKTTLQAAVSGAGMIAQSPVAADGRFALILPPKLGTGVKLQPATLVFDPGGSGEKGCQQTMTEQVSDKSVKLAVVSFTTASGMEVASYHEQLLLSPPSVSAIVGNVVYATGDVTYRAQVRCQGKYQKTYLFDVALRRGWNVVNTMVDVKLSGTVAKVSAGDLIAPFRAGELTLPK